MKFYMNIREVKSRGCRGDLNIRQGGPMRSENIIQNLSELFPFFRYQVEGKSEIVLNRKILK